MKRIFAVLAVVGVLALGVAPVANAGFDIKKYDCDFSDGFQGFVKDYLRSNLPGLADALVGLFPGFTFDNSNSLGATASNSSFSVSDPKVAFEVARTKTEINLPGLDTLNPIFHFACFEIIETE